MAKLKSTARSKKASRTASVASLPSKRVALLERLNDRFPNFLLGLTVVVLGALVLSIVFQSKDTSRQSFTNKVASLFGMKKNESPAATPARTYTVKKGDSLWVIAENAYGSGFNAFDLAKANGIADPNQLNEGEVIELPAMEPKTPTQGEIASGVFTTSEETPQDSVATAPSRSPYTVQRGDSLWLISMRQYGNPYRWPEIWKNNPSVTNPDLIYAGSVLNLSR